MKLCYRAKMLTTLANEDKNINGLWKKMMLDAI
jgi:hypothetical protein